MDNKGEIIIYQTQDGQTKIEVNFEDETVWLTQAKMAELFQTTKQNVSDHINNIYEEGELEENSTVKDFLTVQNEGVRTVSRKVKHYNLDVIISVGYRVKSHRGTQFRIWALKLIKEYIIKGFTMDDERLKNLGGGQYFEELLARIRDIRSSEKVFWRKVLDIYATSIDYDPNVETTKTFFKTIQNKMHWASHAHTAAEVIFERADSSKDFMGLTNWKGNLPTKAETEVAKNYLVEKEIFVLDRLVSAYLDFAEIQAIEENPMHMKDWIEQLDGFIKLSKKDILTHSGAISHEQAMDKVHKEYEEYKKRLDNELTEVEKHYLNEIIELKKLEKK